LHPFLGPAGVRRIEGKRRRSKVISIRKVGGKGRGILAERKFARGEVIERAPVIVLP
jgi:hypothetical protein